MDPLTKGILIGMVFTSVTFGPMVKHAWEITVDAEQNAPSVVEINIPPIPAVASSLDFG